MKDYQTIQSDFETLSKSFDEVSSAPLTISGAIGFIDFSKAELIEATGGSCDVYAIRRHQMRLLVKRLKPEHRFKPRFRAAIQKEFELGFRLRHPALPVFHDFGEDFIVMDFVEGETLKHLIDKKDPFLKSEANLCKIISQLVNVVDYLHQNNTVHCDIKPDNLMITRSTRNLMLIDLGNAYTDWHPSTAGDPKLYGADSTTSGSPGIDFRGIGLILDLLKAEGYKIRRFHRIRKLCDKPGVSPEELRRNLLPSDHNRVLFTGLLLLTVIVGMLFWLFGNPDATDDPIPDHTKDSVTVAPSPILNAKDSEPTSTNRESATDASPAIKGDAPHPTPKYQEIINREIKTRLNEVYENIAECERLTADPDATYEQMHNAISTTCGHFSNLSMQLSAEYEERFPDIPPIEIQLAVANSTDYHRASKQLTVAIKALADKINDPTR